MTWEASFSTAFWRTCGVDMAWESESQPDRRSFSEISQAISGEIILDRLMETLMRSALELTGADRGLLILLAHENPQIGAEATANAGRIDLTLKPVIEAAPRACRVAPPTSDSDTRAGAHRRSAKG